MARPYRSMPGMAWLAVPILLAGCASGPPAGNGNAPDPSPQTRLQKPDSEMTLPPAGGPAGSDAPSAPPSGEFAVRVRAKVNGVAILDEELKSLVYPVLVELRNRPEPQRSALMKQALEKALDHLIEREVVLSTAFARLKGPQGAKLLEKLKKQANKDFDKRIRQMKERSGCKTDEEFKQLLRQQGQSLELARRSYERETVANEFMRFLVMEDTDKIGLKDVEDYYGGNPREFQTYDNVQWQDIFIAAGSHGGLDGARRLAEAIVQQARGGADFARLCERYDEGYSKFHNGEGEGRRHGEIRPAEAEQFLFQMRDGEVGPLVELDTGIHIIRLVKREYAGLMPLDEKLQKFILNKLKSQAVQRAWKRKLKDLMSRAIIEKDLTP